MDLGTVGPTRGHPGRRETRLLYGDPRAKGRGLGGRGLREARPLAPPRAARSRSRTHTHTRCAARVCTRAPKVIQSHHDCPVQGIRLRAPDQRRQLRPGASSGLQRWQGPQEVQGGVSHHVQHRPREWAPLQLHPESPPEHVGSVPSFPVFSGRWRCLSPACSFWLGPGLDRWASSLRLRLLHRRPQQAKSGCRGVSCPPRLDGHHCVLCLPAPRLGEDRPGWRVPALPLKSPGCRLSFVPRDLPSLHYFFF